MKGAFTAGALSVFYKKLGPDYFNVIYSDSVGVGGQAFYAAKEPNIMEDIWANRVNGKKLIDFFNVFRGGPILKLDYLLGLFKSESSKLKLDAMLKSKPELFCIATDYSTKKPCIFNLKKGDTFAVMKATCAIPILYNQKVFIDGRRYIDGGLSIKKIYELILEHLEGDHFEEIVIIVNKKGLLHSDMPNMKILKPSAMPLWHSLDTNQERIKATIAQGKKDAEIFTSSFPTRAGLVRRQI